MGGETILDALTIEKTEDGAGAGPFFTLTRNSSSPAKSDVLGKIQWYGKNANDDTIRYASIDTVIRKTDAGDDNSKIQLTVRKDGQHKPILSVSNEGALLHVDAPVVFQNSGYKKTFVSDINDIQDFKPSYSLSDRVRSFIKVQDGCDDNCTFCTIPMARGRSRSATIADIIVVADSLRAMGFNEIVLSGINLGDFGKGESSESLYNLLESLELRSDIPRIKLIHMIISKILTMVSPFISPLRDILSK